MNLNRLKSVIFQNIKTYWTLPIVTIFLLVLIFAIIIPMYRQIHAIQEKIILEKNELETKYIRRQTIRRTLSALKRIREEWPKLFNSLYPEFGREIDFINTLEKTADKFDLASELRLEPGLGSPLSHALQKVPLQITIYGQFHNLLAYLDELENKPFVLNLKNIKITRTRADGTVRADIRFDSYWQKL